MTYQPSNTVQDPEVLRELHKIAGILNQGLEVRTTAPPRPQDGMVVIADGLFWDPLASGLKGPVWYDKAVDAWKAF